MKACKNAQAESLGEYIESDPAICGGEPVIKGTRVRVRDVLELLAKGHRLEDISQSFPRVSPEAAAEALEFAGEILSETYRTRKNIRR